MNDESRDLLDDLADDFLVRYRRGERPALTEYTDKHPELADEVRDVFSALILMEQARPEPCAATPGSGFALEGSGGSKKLDRLGDYRILREVGRGGMGIVYEAEQESLGRHVALKVLPTHSLLDPRQLQRFEREARAAAPLHHTNIVPVFGVGEQDGLHYYVMQFIQGLGLDQVLVELKRLRKRNRVEQDSFPTNLQSANVDDTGIGSRVWLNRGDATRRESKESAIGVAQALTTGQFQTSEGASDPMGATDGGSDSSLRVRLSSDSSPCSVHLPGQPARTTLSERGRQYWQSVARIGVQVADALAYANSQGVQHRDIKPSNLLLDTQGTVWVTDFGLAKADDSDDLTHTGDIVGTLRYLAERLRGQSDQRSDIYSLGVTLYELLTQRPAFDESDRHKLMRQISHEEPRRPHMLEPEIPLDLETIVLKAIEKEPAQRYTSAGELAEDLRRFLADRPIQARRVAVWERTWRLCRRNPWLSGLSAAVAVLVMAVAVISLIAAFRLGKERNATRDQLEMTQKAEATANHRLYRTTVNQAHAVRRSGQLGARANSLRLLDDAIRMAHELELPPQDFHELRNELIASLALMDLQQVKQWPGFSVDTITVAFTPNLDRYARAKRENRK